MLPMTASLAEIADEKQAQRWLRLAQFSVEHAADAIFWVDRDARLIYANEQAVRTLGYSREDLLSLRVADFDPLFPLSDWPEVWANLRHEGFLVMESIHRRKDGSEFPVWVSAVFYADEDIEISFACCRDISEKRAAEQALLLANEALEQRVSLRTAELAASEQRYQELYHHAPDMFRSVDCRNGQVLQCNRTLLEATGYTMEEMAGQFLTDLYHPDCRQQARETWDEFMRTGEIRDRELVLLCKNGNTVEISLSMTAGYDAEGKIAYSDAIFRDITAYKHAEHQIERHRNELAHAGRLATTGEMAAGLAHELNQPLYALNNFAQGALRRLEDGTLDKESLTAVLQDVARESKRAADTIRSLRRYVRKREQQRAPADANDIMRRVIRLLSGEAKRREVVLSGSFEHDLPSVFCDVIQIEQVLLNLILNAMDAMSDESSDEERIELRTRAESNSTVEFAVIDRGAGLAPGDEDKIFDAFYTTKEEGIGLGLAISRTIIESHGSRLTVAPNSDRGVTMSFILSTAPSSNHS
jgi:PAS domain S-box-containing protein